ncbi:hypothetical protein FQ154_05240 [Paeniglutamicibacter gangotriensis]|uniref:Uncharacterized protein n=1 Tax=Paeniglutamicibacter gangotriensis TaxID=254787 RepID=A0A5B0EKE4_9MICC|nr:hypothetical protein [Paeniglutamicibacter gangotriensis]KAA0978635.1 hypothetical protein FQ154_05240 [Paeniglutamicibacter gangotriensis]
MAAYNLQSNESFVHRCEGVVHGGIWATYSDELMLTSQNLVLIKKGAFGNTKGVQVFPLHDIKIFQGQAQVLVGKQRSGFPSLDVYFHNGTEQFGFQKKKEAAFWSKKINEVVTGAPTEMPSPNASGTEKVAGAMKDTVDAVKDAFGFKSKAEVAAVAAALPFAGACGSCGAPVTGVRGRAVICSYCDSATQL